MARDAVAVSPGGGHYKGCSSGAAFSRHSRAALSSCHSPLESSFLDQFLRRPCKARVVLRGPAPLRLDFGVPWSAGRARMAGEEPEAGAAAGALPALSARGHEYAPAAAAAARDLKAAAAEPVRHEQAAAAAPPGDADGSHMQPPCAEALAAQFQAQLAALTALSLGQVPPESVVLAACGGRVPAAAVSALFRASTKLVSTALVSALLLADPALPLRVSCPAGSLSAALSHSDRPPPAAGRRARPGGRRPPQQPSHSSRQPGGRGGRPADSRGA